VKLFWKDQYLRDFTACIVKKLVLNNRPAVVLDQTGFYATSGGQPNDTGILGGVKVVDVVEDASNHDTIVHVLEKEIGEPEGATVKGEIDWHRRMDHMQQHHGQHLLSKAFIDIANAGTLSFHLGEEVSYIDLNSRDLSEEEQRKAQERVNLIVYQNKPVQTSFHTLAEAKKLPLRKLDDAVKEPVRIVQVGEGESLYDMQACCGTHPAYTGQVQSVAIVNYERIKKTTRLYFVCGLRAVNLLYKQSQALKRLGLRLTAPPDADSVEKAFDKHLEEVEFLRKKMAEEEKKVVKDIVKNIEQKLIPHKNTPAIKLASVDMEGRDMIITRTVAKQLLSSSTSTLLALLSKTDDETIVFTFGASPDLAADLRPLLKDTFAKFPGKGGGDGRFVQGSFAGAKDVVPIREYVEEKLHELSITATPSKK